MRVLCTALLLAALPLGGCCQSMGSCDGSLATARASWDGLGVPPADEAPAGTPRDLATNRSEGKNEGTKLAYDRSKARDRSEGEEAERPLNDDQLKQKLIICQGCGTRGSERIVDKPMLSAPPGWNSD